MPVCVAQTVQKGTVRDATVCHDGYLVSACLPPHTPGCTASRQVRLEWSQSDTLVGELERGLRSSSLPRQAPCRGRCLVASGSLSLTGPCRDAWRVAASSLKCLGWPSRQAPLVGVLCFEWPSRQAPLVGVLCFEWPSQQAPLAGALCLGSNTLSLNGSKGTVEDLDGRLASLAAGCCD